MCLKRLVLSTPSLLSSDPSAFLALSLFLQVYEGLIAGTLPVYRGAEQISKFLPAKNAVINANHMSARDIADLLIRLGKDEAAYNEHFAYKQQPLSEKFQEVAERSYCHPNALCRLCDYGLNYRNTHRRMLSNNATEQ